jgi:hypothetical protein
VAPRALARRFRSRQVARECGLSRGAPSFFPPGSTRARSATTLIAEEDYRYEYPLVVDGPMQRKLVVQASVHAGYPTMFAYRVLLTILKKAESLGWASTHPDHQSGDCPDARIRARGKRLQVHRPGHHGAQRHGI